MIEALTTSLSLDASQFKAGVATVNVNLSSLIKASEGAAKGTNKAASDMAAGQRKAGKDVEASTAGMVEGYRKVRNSLVGMLALFAGTKSIAGLTSDITHQDAALGRLAYRMGMSATELGAWQGAATRAGGSAGAISQSIGGLQAKFEEFKLTGQGGDSLIPWLNRLGVSVKALDAGDLTKFNTELADAFANQDKTDRKATDLYGAKLGYDQSSIDFMRHGGAYVTASLERQRKYAPTDEDTKNSQEVLGEFDDMGSRIKQFARHLLNDLTPSLTRLMASFGGFLDRVLPGLETWLDAHVKHIAEAVEKWLNSVKWVDVEAKIEHFGAAIEHMFDVLSKWEMPGWMKWIARKAGFTIGDDGTVSADKAGGGGSGSSAGADVGETDAPKNAFGGIDTASSAQRVINFFTAKGKKDFMGAGVAGNAEQESGFNTKAINGEHQGMFQWSASRRKAIEEHFHKPVLKMSFDEQLEAAYWEMYGEGGGSHAAGKALDASTSARGASNAIAHHFEIPVSADDPDAAKKWANEEEWRGKYTDFAMRGNVGEGKAKLDHNQGFLDGLLSPPPEVNEPRKPWVLAPPVPMPNQPIPKLGEDGKDYPGDGTPETPDLKGYEAFKQGGDGPQPVTPEQENPVEPPLPGAGAPHTLADVRNALRSLPRRDRAAVASTSPRGKVQGSGTPRPAIDPTQVPSTAGDRTASAQGRIAGGGDNTYAMNTGPITIHTQATDARGIAAALHGELNARQKATQADRGLA